MDPWYQCAHSLSRFVARVFFGYQVFGAEHIPDQGGCLLAMNHESFLDPPAAGIATNRPVYYLGRKSLMDNPIMGAVLSRVNVVPVDQSRTDVAALKIIVRLVRAEHAVLIFPEGTRTRTGRLGPAQPGLGFVVARTGVPVIPIRIFGSFQAFPPNGKPKLWHPLQVVIGEPMHFDTTTDGDSRTRYQAISEKVMERIANMPRPESA